MAERSAERPAVCLEFAFDRLLPIKLQQVYGLLVANCVRPVGADLRGEQRRRP
jgi:hypothetical protein